MDVQAGEWAIGIIESHGVRLRGDSLRGWRGTDESACFLSEHRIWGASVVVPHMNDADFYYRLHGFAKSDFNCSVCMIQSEASPKLST